MYFRRLELFGFKSFADRTRLDFEPGVTAVVGPNGCGKSNIADGIKWVLGEQSAKMLRGGKMEDVIFNGTDGKEPVSFAEVSLTLSNKDRILPIEYDEVTVSRRLYRSGESEYLLNKTPVRLKDINELFMGTGIGTSAYSLIEQGRIGQILSSKAEDRREVFEEAAGITKYKSKKKEAMRRMEDTDQNLIRINDIVLEVKRQINSIERQAKKAERYKERYDELKNLELKLSRIELEILKQKLSEFNKDVDGHKTKETDISAKLTKLQDGLSELNAKRSQVETKRMDFRSSIIEMDSEIAKSKDKIILNRERIEELKKRRMDLEIEIEKSKGSVASQKKEVISLREKVSVLEREDVERAGILSQKEKRLNEISKSIVGCETNISTSKANVIDIVSNQTKLRNQIARISTTLGTHDARLKRLEKESGTIYEEKSTLDAKFKDAQEEIEIIDKEALSLKAEKDSLSKTISDLTSSIERLQVESNQIHKDLATKKSRLEVFEEAKLKYEGFSSGVRAVFGKDSSEDKKALEGMRDVLVNLLSVEKGYEVAIESALGEYLQSIVVESMESAKDAVSYLKEHSYGRASFIHPGSFNNMARTIEDANLKDPRVLGKAVDFIRIDEEYKNILRYLLRDTFIVKDLEEGISILKDSAMKGYVFLTLAGEVVKEGLVSGGGVGSAEGTLINRDTKIKELSDAITEFEKDFHRIEQEILNDEDKKGELEKRLEEVNARSNEKEIFLANAKTRCTNIEENIKGMADEISLLNLEIDEVKGEMEGLKEEELSVTVALDKTEKDAKINEEVIKENESLITEYAKEKEQLLIETAEQRTELGSVESKKEGLSNTLSLLESSFNDTENALISRKTELEASVKKAEELSQDALNLEESITRLSGERIKKNKELESVERFYSEMMQEIEQGSEVSRQSEKEINGLRSNLHGVDLKKAEANYSINNLSQRIRDVYKVDLDEIQIDEGWQDIETEKLKNDVEEKRAKLDSMGTVNLVAIEEHTELQERYAFLTNQRDDLEKAKDSLLKAIAKINKTTKDLFIETFRSIQVEFRNFFKMLFGGGDGELVLLDESNVLESGIEIIARPPGKRLQNVSLLSGGEKALTAIALIFAIFKVKPSPFCVLDEIDAPLDESNIGRFSRMLEIFTKTSQFIVITHSKKTIDIADVMYGITMQESGVSKVISVKFQDAKKQEVKTATSSS